jgi:hypothetical protein
MLHILLPALVVLAFACGRPIVFRRCVESKQSILEPQGRVLHTSLPALVVLAFACGRAVVFRRCVLCQESKQSILETQGRMLHTVLPALVVSASTGGTGCAVKLSRVLVCCFGSTVHASEAELQKKQVR